MAIDIREINGASCSKDDSGVKTWTRQFILKDTTDASIVPSTAWSSAYAYVKSTAKTYDGLHAKSVSFDEQADSARKVYHFTVSYTVDGELTEEEDTPTTVRGTLRFSTKGGSSHINKSMATTAYGADGATPPDFKGLINVVNGQAQGVDIQTPALHIDVTCKIPTSWVTTQWLSNFYELTACTNSDTLWSFPAGTLLFRGLDGTTDGQGTCNLTFSFDYSPIHEGSIEPFAGVEKGGWQYAWVYTELRTDATTNTTIPQPLGMYIETVYKEASFAPFNFITIA